jgi:hypothetical protein
MNAMADDKPNVVQRATRTATAPVRNYINNHFEMVKQEVRANAAGPAPDSTAGESPGAWSRVAELENLLAEQSVHQARVLSRLTEEVVELAARIEDLERVVRQLATVVAAPAPDG